jgi:hypothetical protein
LKNLNDAIKIVAALGLAQTLQFSLLELVDLGDGTILRPCAQCGFADHGWRLSYSF